MTADRARGSSPDGSAWVSNPAPAGFAGSAGAGSRCYFTVTVTSIDVVVIESSA